MDAKSIFFGFSVTIIYAINQMPSNTNHKLVRVTTVPLSLDLLLAGQLNFMNSFYDVSAVSSDEAYLKKIAVKENVKTFTLEMSRKITPIQDISAVIKFLFYLIKHKPQIVHSHTPKAGIVAMFAAKLAGVPIRMHTVAGLPLMESKGLKRKLLMQIEKLTYRFATNVYPNSKGLLDFIVANNFTNSNKLKVIANGSSNGIDCEYFSPDKISESIKNNLKIDLNIYDNDFVFVFVGRLVGDKGINETVAAFKKIAQAKTNVKLLLVGMLETDLDPLNQNTLDEINNNKNILFVGFQKDIRPYLSISNAMIFASYREGFPNVVLQAGAMGLPCIVTDINGCNEIIIEGKNGLIIPTKNANAIENAVLKVIENSDFYYQLKANARSMICSRFEQKIMWDAILNEYKNTENLVFTDLKSNVDKENFSI